MSHKLAKAIKSNKRKYQAHQAHKASKSASRNHAKSQRLGDRLLHLGSITNVSTGTFAVLMSVLFLSILINDSSAYATPYSMTVTLDDNVVDLSVSPSEAGTFVKSSDSTVSVSTTNATGYTLSIASSDNTGDKLLLGGDSNNSSDSANYLSSITSATTEEQFKALNGTAYNNMWGYLPSKWDAKANTSFLPSPATTGDVLDITTTANSTANDYTLAIGARVDTSQKIGSYSNTYVVLATANGVPYTITYIDDTITGFPTDESATAMSETVQISGNTPVRPGYTFLGWCSVAPTATATNNVSTDTCSGTTYAVGSTWELDQTVSTNNLVLHAMWQELTVQTFTNSMCLAQASDHDVTLKDIRDGKTYTVRYINGNCWMTQNLAVEPGTHMTAADTNITAAQYNNTDYYSLPGEGYDVYSNWYSGTAPGNCYGDNAGGVYNGNGWINACSHLPNIVDTSGTDYTSIQMGAWYNYAAATAGTIVGASDNSTKDSYNICPKNWSLPTQSQLSAIVSYTTAFNPIRGGAYGSNVSPIDPTGIGTWWSSDASDGRTRHALYYSDNVLSMNYGRRYHGMYVRCVRTN